MHTHACMHACLTAGRLLAAHPPRCRPRCGIPGLHVGSWPGSHAAGTAGNWEGGQAHEASLPARAPAHRRPTRACMRPRPVCLPSSITERWLRTAWRRSAAPLHRPVRRRVASLQLAAAVRRRAHVELSSYAPWGPASRCSLHMRGSAHALGCARPCTRRALRVCVAERPHRRCGCAVVRSVRLEAYKLAGFAMRSGIRGG